MSHATAVYCPQVFTAARFPDMSAAPDNTIDATIVRSAGRWCAITAADDYRCRPLALRDLPPYLFAMMYYKAPGPPNTTAALLLHRAQLQQPHPQRDSHHIVQRRRLTLQQLITEPPCRPPDDAAPEQRASYAKFALANFVPWLAAPPTAEDTDALWQALRTWEAAATSDDASTWQRAAARILANISSRAAARQRCVQHAAQRTEEQRKSAALLRSLAAARAAPATETDSDDDSTVSPLPLPFSSSLPPSFPPFACSLPSLTCSDCRLSDSFTHTHAHFTHLLTRLIHSLTHSFTHLFTLT